MRLPATAHTSRSWRIHEIAPDFRLEDVWALPTPGGPDDFPRLAELAGSLDPAASSSRAVRALFAIRWKVGPTHGGTNRRFAGQNPQPGARIDYVLAKKADRVNLKVLDFDGSTIRRGPRPCT